MVFSDLFFLFVFIPAFAICYLLAGVIDKRVLYRRDKLLYIDEDNGEEGARDAADKPGFASRNFALVIFSLLFYAWGEPVYIFLMLVCVVINYFAGLAVARSTRHRKLALIIGLALDLGLLGTFKYLGFFGDILNSVGLAVNVPKVALPIGISFYIFQSISYLVDVYRRETPVQKRFMDLLLYIAMFPQLIAGPIVRYGTVAKELHQRHVSAADLADGIYRFLIGLGKKVIIANMLSEIATLFLADGVENLSIWGAWIGILAFTLQIYFDFSGYSDMAIGMGRCMGFHFPENFYHPYCCTTSTDFWRRWHMSLGSFFRDYAYIPLGGNRRHQALNIFTVWFLTGMWHGASWNFIIWGLYFGTILALEKVSIIKWQKHIPNVLLRLYALFIVVVGWGIFYFDNFDKMKLWFSSAFGQKSLEFGFQELTSLTDNFWLWVVAILFCIPLRSYIERGSEYVAGKVAGSNGRHIMAVGRAFVSILLLALCVALLVGATNNAFIYTRF